MACIIFLHLSWATFERRPMIGPAEAAFLDRFLAAEARRHGGRVVAKGLVADHVHLIVRTDVRFDVPRLMQGLKGASARVANRDGHSRTGLRWARGYDARSISPGNVANAVAYVKAQARRHPDRFVLSA
jgi:putative transposase